MRGFLFGSSMLQLRSPRSWMFIVFAVLSVFMHVLLLETLISGGEKRSPMRQVPEAAVSSLSESSAVFVSTMVLIKDSSITQPDGPRDDAAYAVRAAAKEQSKTELVVASDTPPITPDNAEASDGSSTSADASTESINDGAGRVALFGKYMDQVRARIERAWTSPEHSAVSEFKCRVQIKQRSNGEVEEVTLVSCGDDPVWQVSLVQAVQSASPLSLAPDPRVFTNVLTLNFERTLN